MEQPTQHELPLAAPAASASSGADQIAAGGTKRLKRAVIALAGGAMIMIGAIGGGELGLPNGSSPSDLIAPLVAWTKRGITNQPANVTLTKAAYHAKLADAQRVGAANARRALQQKLAKVRVDRERVAAAYSALHQRTVEIAGIAFESASVAQILRQQLLAMLSRDDMLCDFSGLKSCDAMHAARADVIAELGKLSGDDDPARLLKLMAGIVDPAAFTGDADEESQDGLAIARR